MFIEVPYLAAHENDQRRRIISKYFYHSMKQSERHALSGPPETLPEYVIAASKAMKTGDWKRCTDLILSDKLNKRVWNFFHQGDKIRSMLAARLQESSLRCFMFSNSAFYDAISVKTLSQMFDLSKEVRGLPQAHSTVTISPYWQQLTSSKVQQSVCVLCPGGAAYRPQPLRHTMCCTDPYSWAPFPCDMMKG